MKSCDIKLFAMAVPVGVGLNEALGDMAYSVLDRPACLLVQPFCDVSFEVRFVSVAREIVTFSSVAWHLTPISRLPSGALFRTPKSTAYEHQPETERRLLELASRVAETCRYDSVIIDCALIDGTPGVIEFNPFSVGNFGLYACDPAAIATKLSERLLREMGDG